MASMEVEENAAIVKWDCDLIEQMYPWINLTYYNKIEGTERNILSTDYCFDFWPRAGTCAGGKIFFCAITLVPDMLKGQARALSTREII